MGAFGSSGMGGGVGGVVVASAIRAVVLSVLVEAAFLDLDRDVDFLIPRVAGLALGGILQLYARLNESSEETRIFYGSL